MIKKCSVLAALVLAACAAAPLTPEATKYGVAHSLGTQICYQRGWVSNPQMMAGYLNAVQSRLQRRGDPALISQAERELSSLKMNIQDCRQLEMKAHQYFQQQAEQARQQQQFDAAMEELAQTGQQMQSQYRPQTTTCQHYQWGNMTSCTSY